MKWLSLIVILLIRKYPTQKRSDPSELGNISTGVANSDLEGSMALFFSSPYTSCDSNYLFLNSCL